MPSHGFERLVAQFGKGGHVRQFLKALRAADRQWPHRLDVRKRRRNVNERARQLAAHDVGDHGCRPLEWRMRQIDTRLHFEQFALEMGAAGDAVAAVAGLVRIALGLGHELCHRLHRGVIGHDEQVGRANRHDHREQVLEGIEGQFFHHRGLLDQHAVVGQQRVAIRRGLDGGLRADDSRGSRLVVDVNGLSPGLLQLLADHARHCVRSTSGGVRNNDLDGGAGVGGLRHSARERPWAAGQEGQRGSGEHASNHLHGVVSKQSLCCRWGEMLLSA